MSYIKTPEERENPEPEVQYRKPEEERVTLKHVLKPFSAWLKAFSTPYTVPKSRGNPPGLRDLSRLARQRFGPVHGLR